MAKPHHKGCRVYDEKIRVVKIGHEGSYFYDKDLTSALEGLAGGDDYLYSIEFMQMSKLAYEELPEFQGF